MQNDQPSTASDPRDQLIINLQAQLQQAHAHIAYLEQYRASSAEPAVNRRPRRRIWVVVGILVILGCLAFLVTASILLFSSPPAGRSAQSLRSAAQDVTPDATAQSVQATVTALTKTATRVHGPTSGKLIHKGDNRIPLKSTDLNVRDFIVEAEFSNPYQAGTYGWDYGFLFRDTGLLHDYRLYVTSDGEWVLKLTDVSSTPSASIAPGDLTPAPTVTPLPHSAFTTIAGGVIDGFDTSASGSNRLQLVVKGGAAFFLVNDRYITTLDVSKKMESGDVEVATAFITSDNNAGHATPYKGFSVWSLP